MELYSKKERQVGTTSHQSGVLPAVIAILIGVISFGVLSAWLKPPTVLSAPNSIQLDEPAAYLYRFDSAANNYVTITLALSSRPSSVSVVPGNTSDQVWFAEAGLNRIGRVIYTSTVNYSLSEYLVPGSPVQIAASANDVWFTLPASQQVGHLAVATGVVSIVNLPLTTLIDDLAVDANGRVWVTHYAGLQTGVTAISPTLTVLSYPLPEASKPGGIALDPQGNVWVVAASGNVWRLDPLTGGVLQPTSLGPGHVPDQLALGPDDSFWTSLADSNQLAQIAITVPASIVSYTVPTPNSRPGMLGVDAQGQVYYVQQTSNHLGRLGITPTVSFADYALPQSNLKLTDLSIARDGKVWMSAYHDVREVYLPQMFKSYDSIVRKCQRLPVNSGNDVPRAGIQMYGALSSATGFTRVVESGAGLVRFQVHWTNIEPTNTTPDAYNWGGLDNSIQSAADANVQVIFTIETNPSWASGVVNGPVNNLADLQEFVSAAVTRYPCVEYWEFYNEPDEVGRFGLNGAAYAEMLQAVYPVVKAANPNANVVMGGLALDWFIEDGGPFSRTFLDDVITHCAGQCFDLANFHYYPVWRPRWEEYGRDIIGKANYVRQILASHNFTRTVINTETGWAAASWWGSPELQARYVPKAFARGLAGGLPITIWYAMLDMDSSNPGLLDSTMAPRPAYTATRTWVAAMRYARYERTIPASETGTPQIEAYQFSVPAGTGRKRMDIYWYECPTMNAIQPVDCDNVAPLKIQATSVARIDKLGLRVVVNDTDDGYRDGYVTLGVLSSPIYVDYQP